MNKNIIRLLSDFIIISAIVLRVLWAYFTPSWLAPDEYPHFYVVKQLSITHKYPLSKPYFPFYEAFQPPLYYIFSAYLIYPFVDKFDISSDDFDRVLDEKEEPKNYALIFLRLFSVLISAISLILMYRLVFFYFKDKHLLAFFSLIFYCFLPTFVNNGSTVNNDALANLIGLLILFIIVKILPSYKKIILLSIVFSAGILTKSNIIPFFFVVILALFTESIKKREKILYTCLFFLISGIVCFGYMLWNFHRYKTFIPFNPGVTTISPLDNFTLSTLWRAIRNLNWSFWAAAGRVYEVHFPYFVYIFFYLPFSIVSVCGIVKIFWNIIGKDVKIVKILSKKDNRIKIIFLVSIILEITASLYYTLMYPVNCSWGKYIYPILPAIAILFTEGIFGCIRKSIAYVSLIIFSIGLIISNLWLFFKVISS